MLDGNWGRFICADNWMHGNKQVIQEALELDAEIQSSLVTTRDLVNLRQRGCTVLVVATYQWKIPE